MPLLNAGSVPVPGPVPEHAEVVQMVTVWGAEVVFFQVTVSAWKMESLAGVKQKKEQVPPLVMETV